MKSVRIILWLLIITLGAVAALKFSTPSTKVVETSGAGIGGPFSLTAHTGEIFNTDQLKGKYQLIYFGYTYCPDVCPMELLKITETLDALEKLGSDISLIQPLFISVDPTRDTVEAMKNYVESFHSSIIGLTGSALEIKKVAKLFRIYFKKVDNVEDPNGDDYLMDHLNVLILMKPDGTYDRIFSSKDGPEDLVKALAARINILKGKQIAGNP